MTEMNLQSISDGRVIVRSESSQISYCLRASLTSSERQLLRLLTDLDLGTVLVDHPLDHTVSHLG